ncbi:MAG: hypothetical protein ACXQS5_00785 [Candidatus Methanospirareceae archaeon]
MEEKVEEIIKNLTLALTRNRKARFLQKVGLVVTLFIIITFLSLFVTKVMGLSLDGNVVFAAYLSLILPFISK